MNVKLKFLFKKRYKMEKTLMLIDGNSLMYRAFYAMSPILNDRGIYTNAVYGFLNMFLKATQDFAPTHIAVAFDVHEKTFRNDLYKEYKANRSETPEELRPQFAIIKDVLSAMRIKIIEAPKYEADDILGTVSKNAAKKGYKSLLFTGDRDILQLINDDIHVYMTVKGISDVIVFDTAMVNEKYSLKPSQIIDMKGLMGDASDNIPGVKGVGEKTAVKLLTEYETLEGVYENIDKIQGKLKEKLINDKEMAFISKKLATIKTDIDIDVNVDECLMINPEDTNAIEKLEELKFGSIIKKIRAAAGEDGNAAGKIEEIILVDDEKMMDEAIKELAKAQNHSLYKDKEFMYVSDGKTEYKFSLTVDLLGNGYDIKEVLNKIKVLLNKSEIIYVYQLKEWLKYFNEVKIDYKGRIFDTYIAA